MPRSQEIIRRRRPRRRVPNVETFTGESFEKSGEGDGAPSSADGADKPTEPGGAANPDVRIQRQRALKQIIAATWGNVAAALILLALGGVAGVLVPVLVSNALNRGLLAAPPHVLTLLTFSGAAVAAQLVVAFCDGARGYVVARVGAVGAGILRSIAFRNRVGSSMASLTRTHSQSHAATMLSDAAAFSDVPPLLINRMLGGIVSAASALSAMLILSPALTGIALALSVPAVLLLRGVSGLVERRTLEVQDRLRSFFVDIGEALSVQNILLHRTYDRSAFGVVRFDRSNSSVVEAQNRRSSAGIAPIAAVNGLLLSGPPLLFVVIGVAFPGLLESVEAGTLMVFAGLQVAFPASLMMLLSTTIYIRSARSVLDRVYTTVTDSDLDQVGTRRCPSVPALPDGSRHAIRVSELSFSHEGSAVATLSGLSFSVEKGTFVLLDGASGSGKSTLLRLISGLLAPNRGYVAIGDARASGVRSRVELVAQEAYFFNGTIEENLRFVGEDLSSDAIWAALEFVGLSERITTLPDGVRTLVGNGGMELSGGEKQRLALARSLLWDADVILLDEATSALDEAASAALLSALWEQWRGKTIIAVSHHKIVLPPNHTILLLAEGTVQRLV